MYVFDLLTIEQDAVFTGEISSTDYRTNQQSSYRANQQAPKLDSSKDIHPESTAPTSPRLDLSVLDLMPGPITARA